MISNKIKDNKVLESEKKLDIFDKVEVLVVGGGPAGVGAAVTAARRGCKTLLVEQMNALGGLFTLGLVCIPLGYVGGLGKELLERLENVDAHWHRNTDPEKTKRVLDQLIINSGSDMLLMAHAVETIVEDNVIKGVVIESKSGRQAILADIVIDASGDGDVACFAGAPWEYGRKVDGLNQGVSTEFRVANVDWDKHKEWRENDPRWVNTINKAFNNGDLPVMFDNHVNWTTRTPGRPENEGKDEISICFAHSRYCHTLDVRDLTRMAVEGREQVEYLIEFLRDYIPGFEECWLIDTGTLLGIRDSRRIIGEYILTAKDIASHRKFKDVIAISNHGYDIHDPVKPGNIKWAKMEVDNEERYVVCNPGGKGSTSLPPNDGKLVTYQGKDALKAENFDPGEFYDIPYRCLLPLNVENILVAGRCLSATFEAQSGSRLILTCLDMGQAAGTAASIALEENIKVRNVEVNKIQKVLRETGVQIGNNK